MTAAPTRTLTEAPDAVRAAAFAHELGDHYVEHRTAVSRSMRTCGSAACGLAVAIVLWVCVPVAADPGFLVVVAVAATVVGAIAACAAARDLLRAGSTLHVFDRGIVHASGGRADAYPWTDTEVRRGAVTGRGYRFARPGSPDLRIDPAAFRPTLRGPELEGRLAAARAPLDLDAVASGRTVRYGPFALDIATVRTPLGIAEWTQVRAVEVHRGEVRVWLYGACAPHAAPEPEVPNLLVFLALADALRIDAQRA